MGIPTVTSRIFQVLLLACLAMQAHARPAYVTDQLRLGVHTAADTSDGAFTNIASGDRVEILEESRYYAHVRIPDGREGWVKKNYLVADKPAVLRVAELEQARGEAESQLGSLEAALSERESRVAAIEGQAAERAASHQAREAEVETLRAERLELMERLKAYGFAVPGRIFIVAVAASLGLGFAAAWWWFDRRSRRRHGGFRVY